MPKVTGLSPDEVTTLNKALKGILDRVMDIAKAKSADNKAGRVVFKGAQMALSVAEHLPVERKLGELVKLTNSALPRLETYLNDQTLEKVIPAELKTPQIADLCEKAGATPLAKLLRESFAATAAPATPAATVTAPAATSTATAAVVAAGTPVIPAANLAIAPKPVIPAGPKLP